MGSVVRVDWHKERVRRLKDDIDKTEENISLEQVQSIADIYAGVLSNRKQNIISTNIKEKELQNKGIKTEEFLVGTHRLSTLEYIKLCMLMSLYSLDENVFYRKVKELERKKGYNHKLLKLLYKKGF